ncbi:unnamed protein product [Clonostachys byssicola]|uniref:HIG1 domain-containing protein n=1 Tax=Clonostachys byssicola TaxID=160290 RepID=A0A9N9UDE3_9HYPO|nr:unnamed protein product [Clonostachys byssicola]
MADRPPVMPGGMPSSFDDNQVMNEKPLVKVVRKIKEEPLVPLGIGLTVYAFVSAYRALRKGDSQQANRMFRARVLAQGFTVVAMVAGSMYYSKDRAQSAELRKLQEQRDAEEKRQKWIRELEVRDEEEKAFKAQLHEKLKVASAGKDESSPKAEGGTGGILGRMGLWPSGQKKAAEAEAEVANSDLEASEKKHKRENPKSSLGALGEVLSSQKKDKKGDDGEGK